MYRACMPGAFMCSVFNTCGGIDFLQYWTIRCRIQVSYMYQMYRESLGGISAVSQLALMSLVCAVSRPPGPTYPILIQLLMPNPPLLACTTPVCGPRCHSGSSLYIYRVYYPYYCILPLSPTPTTYYRTSLDTHNQMVARRVLTRRAIMQQLFALLRPSGSTWVCAPPGRTRRAATTPARSRSSLALHPR